MPILEARSLSKSFLFKGELSTVLNNIEICLYEKEFVSVIGSSGCGKTTLLELLAGISQPDSGTIRYMKNDITGRTGLLGYMPQDDTLFDWLKVIDNILLPSRVKGRNIKQEREKALKILPVFGLENYTEYLPWQLSGGLRQRVALARTYMTGSKVWLLDEPLANLDAITRESLQDWIHHIVKELELSVLLVTHDIDEALKLSDRIEIMKQGSFQKKIEVNQNADENERRDYSRQIHNMI
jgi:ABC-type nitrate/sulfonate/bicarbonate transport system ATPase subunit